MTTQWCCLYKKPATLPLCLAGAINVQWSPLLTLQGEWYLSSLIIHICSCRVNKHTHTLPWLSQRGFYALPPSLRKQQIFLIYFFDPPHPPTPLSASKWLKCACCCHRGTHWQQPQQLRPEDEDLCYMLMSWTWTNTMRSLDNHVVLTPHLAPFLQTAPVRCLKMFYWQSLKHM